MVPELGEREVHVWWADLSVVDDVLLARTLSPPERERLELPGLELRRRHRAASRAVLRQLLGRYLGLAPELVPLLSANDGRPVIAGEADVRFSVSHAGAYALCAVARGLAVGVDLELARGGQRRLPLRRVFSAHERARLAELDAAAGEREFLRRWTRYEASLKLGSSPVWLAELAVPKPAHAALASDARPRRVLRARWRAGVPVVSRS